MNDLREEIGMQFSLTGRTVRRQIDVSRRPGADGGGLAQKAEAMKQQGSRKGEEDDKWREKAVDRKKWREKAVDREKWREVTDREKWREKVTDMEKWNRILAGVVQQYKN